MKRPARAFVVDRRLWLLPLVLWAGAVGWSLRAHLSDISLHTQQMAAEAARNMFRMVVLTREWNARHGGVYVPVDRGTQPNTYLQHPRRDVTTTEGMQLTLVNPAFMTRQISELARDGAGVQVHITSLRPIRPENAADAWETKALATFESGASEAGELTDGAGGRQFRYMAPLYTQDSCLDCHRQQGYRLGDVRGGISVSLPAQPLDEASVPLRRQTMLSHGLVFLLGSGVSFALLNALRRRWLQLNSKIDELETTRNELLQSEKMASLGRMVAGFAHEINTPIGVAVGAISHNADTLAAIDRLLAAEEVSEQDLRARLAELREGGALAHRNLRRAATLVQSFKRSAVDQSSEQHRRFELRQLIDDVLHALHNELKRHPVKVEVACPGGILIDGVPGLLEQLLTNLLLNSLQHAFPDGRSGHIGITAQVDDREQLHLQYADDGLGMDAANRARIFEPFFTTRRSEGGSGLGLFICYNIVSGRLGGTIAYTSEPGAGCRFDIVFPIKRIAPPVVQDSP